MFDTIFSNFFFLKCWLLNFYILLSLEYLLNLCSIIFKYIYIYIYIYIYKVTFIVF